MARKKKKDTADEGLVILVFLLFGVALFLALLKFIIRNPWMLIIPILFIAFSIYKKMNNHKKIKELKLLQLERTSTINGLYLEFASEPHKFEQYIADIYEFYGFKTQVTKGSNDGGKDIIMQKNDEVYVVEVKLYATYNKIGRDKIQKLQGAKYDTNAQHAIFVSTSNFTKPAIEYANKNDIELVGAEKLTKMINEYRNSLDLKS